MRPDDGPDVSVVRGWTVRLVAGLTLLFLGLPVAVLILRSVLDGSLTDALTTPVVLDALAPEPRHDLDQPGAHGDVRSAARAG